MGLFDIFRRKKDEVQAEAPQEENTAASEEAVSEEPEEAAAAEAENAADSEEAVPAVEETAAPEETAEDTQEEEIPAAEAAPAENITPIPVQNAAGAPQKLTPEEIQARREQARKQQEEMEAKGKLLSYMIDQYHEQRTPKALEAAIRCLGDTVVVVPMRMVLEKSDAEAMALARQQGRQYKPVKPVRLVPAFLNSPKGGLHYPVFASRADIPKDQVKKFVWANIPATRCSLDVVRNEKLEALVVNPFGKSLVLRRELLQKIVKVKPAGEGVETPTVEGEGGYTS